MNVCNVSPSRMDELKRPTDDDVTLQMLVNTIRQGWPTKLHSLPPAMWPFHPYRQELITDDGLVWKGHRVIIPETLRLEYMQTVHGVILEPNLPNNMRVAFNFWPTMTKDIDTYIILCHMQQHQTPPAKRTPSAARSSKPAMVNSSSWHLRMEQSPILGACRLVFRLVWDWSAPEFDLIMCHSKVKETFFCSWITSHPHHRQWETVREQWI